MAVQATPRFASQMLFCAAPQPSSSAVMPARNAGSRRSVDSPGI